MVSELITVAFLKEYIYDEETDRREKEKLQAREHFITLHFTHLECKSLELEITRYFPSENIGKNL